MEIGDKIQIMMIGLAVSSSSFIGTLTGSWVALSSLAIIGAFAGEWLSRKISKEKLDWIAAILFISIGILVVVSLIIP